MSRQSHFGSSNPSALSEQTFFAEQRTTKLTPAFYGHFYPETQKIRPRGSLFDRSMTGFSLLLQYFRCFFPKKQEKTPFALVDKRRFFYGGEEGIWTLARFLHAYSLSRGAPSASWVLLHVKERWRREWDSNPRHIAVSLVFKTSSLNRSDISPCFNR